MDELNNIKIEFIEKLYAYAENNANEKDLIKLVTDFRRALAMFDYWYEHRTDK